MEDKRLFEGEYRLMDLIWEQEPIRSIHLFHRIEKACPEGVREK